MYFCNDAIPNFSEVPAFRPYSIWNPPKGHPNLKVFLSEVEKELLSCIGNTLGYSNLSPGEWKTICCLENDRSIVIKKGYYNLSPGEWKTICCLENDRSIVIKKADKGSVVVVRDRNNYVMEAKKQRNDTNVYKDVAFNEKTLHDLVGTGNKIFQNLQSKGKIYLKQLKYFTYEYKKATNLGKLYLLPKIHERL